MSNEMRKVSKTIAARVKRIITVRNTKPSRSEEVADKRVIAEVNDDSAWEEPILVRRR
jgi:hypothetical protein